MRGGRNGKVALVGKNPPANAGDLGLISGLERSPGGRHDNPLQYSCPENSMDRGAWWAMAHRVSKSQTWLKWLSTHYKLYADNFPQLRGLAAYVVQESTKHMSYSKACFILFNFWDLFFLHSSQVCFLVRCMCAKSFQLCPTLCNPMDCSPPGSSVHRILQARILEWVAISYSRGAPQPRDLTCIS